MLLVVIITCCGWETGKKQTLGILLLYPVSMAGKKEQHWEGSGLHTTHSGFTSGFGYQLTSCFFLLIKTCVHTCCVHKCSSQNANS